MRLTELARATASTTTLSGSLSDDGKAVVLTIRGEADRCTLPVVVDLLERVVAEHHGPVIVDLGPTAFVDTATVAALDRTAQLLLDEGRSFTLRSPSEMAQRIVAVLGFSRLMPPDP